MIGHWLRAAFLAVGLSAAAFAPQAQAPKSFLREDLASQVVRLEQTFKTEGASLIGSRTAAQLRQEGEVLLGQGDARRAAGRFSAAAAIEPGNGANWSAYARATLALYPGANWEERYKLQAREYAQRGRELAARRRR